MDLDESGEEAEDAEPPFVNNGDLDGIELQPLEGDGLLLQQQEFEELLNLLAEDLHWLFENPPDQPPPPLPPQSREPPDPDEEGERDEEGLPLPMSAPPMPPDDVAISAIRNILGEE